MEFTPFPKLARLSRDIVVTEKIDGTQGSIFIGYDDDGTPLFKVGSRTRWITPQDDNHGFAKWAYSNRDELEKLGEGHHFGEWWGQGIQRGYGLNEKRFSLFNTARWSDDFVRPACCHVVPVLYSGMFSEGRINGVLANLAGNGSSADPGFYQPEGIVIYHTAAGISFKKTILKDESPKGLK